MSQPFKLFRLQQLDTLLDQAHNRLKEIDYILSQNEPLLLAQNNLHENEMKLGEEKKELIKIEDSVSTQKIKIEQTETTLYSGKVRNPKELADLENEVGALKRYLAVLEDKQLEGMIQVENSTNIHKKLETNLILIQQEFFSRDIKLNHEKSILLNEIDRLEKDRSVAYSSIEADLLKTYTQIRATKRGVAVSQVSENTCSACGNTLNASLVQAARSPNQLVKCSACGRFLYGG